VLTVVEEEDRELCLGSAEVLLKEKGSPGNLPINRK
jgi:hypothetical protein